MRRGQTTLEYVLLIGIAAAGLIALIVYVSRGHQGNLRSQAEQLSTEQYASGKTTIHNWENKTLKSSVTSVSSTEVQHSAYPIGEINKPLQGDPDKVLPPESDPDYEEAYKLKYGLLGQIGNAWGDVYDKIDLWEFSAARECVGVEGLDDGAAKRVRNGEWPWVPPTTGIQHLEDNDLADALEVLYGPPDSKPPTGLLADAWKLNGSWHDREPDETIGSGTTSSETGTIRTHKHTSETLGDL